MWTDCSLFPNHSGTNWEALSPLLEQQHHIGPHLLTAHPFSMQHPVPSRDQEQVMDSWEAVETEAGQILFLSLLMPHPLCFWCQDFCTQPRVSIGLNHTPEQHTEDRVRLYLRSSWPSPPFWFLQ